MAITGNLNMSVLPPVFILPTHLQTEDMHEAEDMLYHAGGRLSYRAPEARIFLGKVLHKKRATFDLRSRGLWTEEDSLPMAEPVAKRRKISQERDDKTRLQSRSSTLFDMDDGNSKRKQASDRLDQQLPDLTNHIVVLKLDWLDDCNKCSSILPFEPYLIYSGRIIPKPTDEKQSPQAKDSIVYIKAIPESQSRTTPSIQNIRDLTSRSSSILARAKTEAAANQTPSQSIPFHRRKFGQKSTSPIPNKSSHRPGLYRATTSELEKADSSQLPPVPAWVNDKHPRPTYSCLRSTPPIETNPNHHFIAQLNKIKEARLLTLDEIGVRAYSTSIASIAAYSHRITSPLEITRLPGCNDKIATLWVEWHESITPSECSNLLSNDLDSSDRDVALDSRRTIPVVHDLIADTDLSHLRTFHNIWGVGPESARKFYFNHGWKELDDVVEFGWSTLSRVQQIGVKFYEEFQLTIPRPEVEDIARTVLHHARLAKGIDNQYWTNDVVDGHNGATASCLGDPRDFVAVLVGGYRRGKSDSGDVDVILSHRDERLTQDLVVDVVQSLEADGYITHTLTLHTTTSDRGQQTLPYRGGSGHGFDSLDKALCVWQNPQFDDGDADDNGDDDVKNKKKNPNPHRRVDIIVSPWRTVGCAVLGWSGGTTFQRDIRRWAKKEKGWKFDSSGVRDRGTGLVLELEGGDDDGDGSDGGGWEDRERRVMERLGIGWRPARERCTG